MTLIDFFIGALLANAMPHLIFGLTKTHFLGLFGFSPKGNIAYAVLQFIICIILFGIYYDFKNIMENGYLVGGITVVVLYFIFGKILVRFYGKQEKSTKN
ncbi:hypothetical protein [Lacinutrix algicola]|uniref:hypothetical protein n=1 Tax=Lacinutrix algicola TaxID=342954 RepID=UPI0006E4282B|nr:hypothetical protein [Lacinutrix algicola]